MFIRAAGLKDGRFSFFHPLSFFFIFVAANVFLSYFNLSLAESLWLFLFGILVPLTLYVYSKGFALSGELPKESSFAIPAWLWTTVLSAGVFLRIYHATDLCAWPTRDDGFDLFGPLEFHRTGNPFFFFACGELPPFYGWLQYLYFKIDPPSLNAPWRFSMIISIAILPVSYWAARQYFSKFISFLIFGFVCIEFWPVYLGRFLLEYNFLLFWQSLTLGVSGWTLNKQSVRQKKIGAILLALVVAAGFYLYPPPWAPNALFVSVMVLGLCLKSGRFRFSFLFCYLASLFLFLMPLAVEFYFQGYGNHVRSLWAGPALFSSSHLFLVDLPYLFQIFWGGPHHQALYGPWWGGFLNPISTALFLFGAVELWTLRRIWIARGFFLAFVIFLIPGFFSNGVEMMRVENLIPVLLAVMALGTYALVLSLKPQWRIGLVVLFPLSFGLNFYHLAVPFANAARPASPYFAETRSDESYNAFQVIREKARKDGPGLLFLDFLHCPLDQTLYLATFPYNASMNPQLKDAKRTWAAFLTNINYVPFLKSQLPHAQWYVVNPQIDPWDGQLVLGVFALEDSNKTLVDRWSRAEQIFHEWVKNAYRLPVDETGDHVVSPLMDGYSLIQGDRFLESVFWEAVYFNHCMDKKFLDAYQDLWMILRKGYPAAHVYNEMGTIFYAKGDLENARIEFQKAVRFGGDHTDAPENLKTLEMTKKIK